MKNIFSEATIVRTRAGKSGISSNIPSDFVNGVASGFLICLSSHWFEKSPSILFGCFPKFKIRTVAIRAYFLRFYISIRSSDLKKVLVNLPPTKVQKSIGNKIKEATYLKTKIRNKIKKADMKINNLIVHLKI